MKKYKLPILYTLTFLLSACFVYLGLTLMQKPKTSTPIRETEEEIPSKPLQITDNSINILLLGYGGEGHPGGTLSDVLMLAHIDVDTKKVFLISIPRDLWVDIPIRSDKSEFYKINEAHAIGTNDTLYPLKEPQHKGEHGGGNLAKTVVSKVIGFPINYYVGVSFAGFEEAIDILEGIEVESPHTFDDYFYPVKGLENETCGFTGAEIELFHRMYSGFELEKQFTCRYEHLHFNEGLNEMDGPTALKFVRSRHSDQFGGDFSRSQRQMAVLYGVKEKLFDLGALDNTVEFFEKFSGSLKTDINKNIVKDITKLVTDPKSYTSYEINLSTDNVLANSTSSNGAYILIPKDGNGNFKGVQKYIHDEMAKH